MTNGDGDVHANFEIGFDYPGPGQKHPIHENIAIAAFLNSSLTFPKATTYNNLNHKQWEYFRGMIWNDDPECLLFEKSTDDNRLVPQVPLRQQKLHDSKISFRGSTVPPFHGRCGERTAAHDT